MATTISMNLYGVGGANSHHPHKGIINVEAATWGFDLTPGSGTFEYGEPVVPTVVTMRLTSYRTSPQLMSKMLTKTVLSTGVIRVSQPNAQGVGKVVATITLHSVRIVDFRQHVDGHETGDTVQLSFSGLDYSYPPGPTATYAPPA